MTNLEPTIEEAIDNIEKSVELLVETQWKLNALGTLSPIVQDGLYNGTIDLMSVLVMASPERGIALSERLINKRVEYETDTAMIDIEELLKSERPQDS